MPRGAASARPSPRRCGAVWPACAIVAVAGCSAGHYGLLTAAVSDGDGARLVTVTTYGADLRTLAVDAGLTLGWGHRVYIYPLDTPGLPPPGSYAFAVALPAQPPLAWDVRSLGLDVRTGSVEVGAVLGWRATTVLVRAPVGSDLSFGLSYDTTRPGATRLELNPTNP